MQTIDYTDAVETNGLVNPEEYHKTDRSTVVTLDDPRLAKINRLRLLTSPGFPMWDVSYCHGVLAGGTPVTVQLPWSQFSKRSLARDLIRMCKESGRYGKGLDIFHAVSTVR